MVSVTVRPLRASDVPAVTELIEAGHLSHAPRLSRALAAHPYGALCIIASAAGCASAAWAAGSSHAIVCVATVVGAAVGAALLRALAAWALRQYVTQCRSGDMSDLLGYYDETHRAVLFVAESSAGILGSLALRPFGGADSRVAELKRVSTRQDAQKCGVASALLAAGEAWALRHGYDDIVLTTGSFQPSAHALYSRRGYAEAVLERAPFKGIGWCGTTRHTFKKSLTRDAARAERGGALYSSAAAAASATEVLRPATRRAGAPRRERAA